MTETELSKAHVRRHLQTLSRACAVVPGPGARIAGVEVVYGLALRGLPRWAFEGLIGKFVPAVCLAVSVALDEAETLEPADVAEQVGLSENDTARYLLFMEAVGWLETETSPWPNNPLRMYVKRVKNGWWLRLGLGPADDADRRGDES